MNKEEKEILIRGYQLELLLKINDLKVDNAKDLKKTLLECVDILDKVIKLEEEHEN